MKPIAVKRLRRILAQRGCTELRQSGSHLIVSCGGCHSTIPVHAGEVAPGTLRAIERALAPCLGAGWLQRER